MLVHDVMTADVQCLKPTDTIAHAAARMQKLDVGSLPVCNQHERLVGMLTDRDITVRATAEGCEPDKTQVQDVMTPNVIYCYEFQNVLEAARLMEARQVRRIVVLDNRKRIVGIVSLGDLAVRIGNEQLSGEALELVSEPAATPA